jgi:hypothetical protein
MTTDPRKAPGSITGGAPHERGTATIDATNAVLLDHIHTAMVEPSIKGNPQTPVVAMSLAGRINRTEDRADIVYLFDAEAAAALCADLIGLMHRSGNQEFPALLEDALRRQP